MNPAAVLFSLESAKSDPALRTRGDRKLLVTEIYSGKEEAISGSHWSHETISGKCPVLLMRDTESALFNQLAKQTRHFHKIGTEIYALLEGMMTIEVEGTNHTLSPGDMLVVLPGAHHEVRRAGVYFVPNLFTVNCGGAKDRCE